MALNLWIDKKYVSSLVPKNRSFKDIACSVLSNVSSYNRRATVTIEPYKTPEQQQLMQTTAKGETLVSVTVLDESGEAPVQCEMLWAWLDKASLKK